MSAINPENWLCSNRVVRFGDTDAAGVMHFYQLFRWCHESWEESLQSYGLKASDVFPGCRNIGDDPEIALPIFHTQADFFKPIRTGDYLSIRLLPTKIDLCSFQVQTTFECSGDLVATSLVRHIAINAQTRKRCALPHNIDLWLEASSVNAQPRPL